MKAIKIFFGILLALVVVIAIALFIGVKNLDGLVEAAIESVGPTVTKTDVKVDSVKIQLTKGRGEVHSLTLANLPGYSDKPIFRVGQVALQIAPGSLTKDVIVIEEILVDGAQLSAEHKGVADINLKELLDNMTSGSAEPESTTASPDLRFMVEQLSFTNAQLHLSSTELGERDLAMKDIRLSNLGDKERGLTSQELTKALLQPLIAQAQTRVAREIRDLAGDSIKDKLEDKLSDEDKSKVEKLKGLLSR